MRGYSTREVAEVLGLPTSQILGWTRAGLLSPERGPGGAYVFSFQDIVLLRTARELLEEDVPARRVRRALEALREQLPTGRPLSAVHISAVGDRVVVRDESATWDPDSGQIQLDFAVSEVAEAAAPVARRVLDATPPDPEMDADDWYDTGVDLEAVDIDRAIESYERALVLDETHAEALLNLGRLLHEQGDLDAAIERYRTALEADPSSAPARYNLGVALEDQGRSEEAIEAYERAVELDASLAAAHFNVSRLLNAAGRRPDALRHLNAYRQLLRRGGGGTP